jgi:superfamily II DNA/RNA helicase
VHSALLRWIPKIKGLAIVFVATKRSADMIHDWFRREKIGAACIHGDRTQDQREQALQDFRVGKCKYLVATDVAARGLGTFLLYLFGSSDNMVIRCCQCHVGHQLRPS